AQAPGPQARLRRPGQLAEQFRLTHLLAALGLPGSPGRGRLLPEAAAAQAQVLRRGAAVHRPRAERGYRADPLALGLFLLGLLFLNLPGLGQALGLLGRGGRVAALAAVR